MSKRNELDWSDSPVMKSLEKFNGMLRVKKATTSSIHGGRSTITGHETGVHMPMASGPGHSAMGNKARYGTQSHSAGSPKAQVAARTKESRAIKPKLPG